MSISGWVYAFTVRIQGPLQGAGLLDYQRSREFFIKGVTGLEGEKTRSLPSIFLVEEQDKEQVMVGKERQV